jgi:hypothetical protein
MRERKLHFLSCSGKYPLKYAISVSLCLSLPLSVTHIQIHTHISIYFIFIQYVKCHITNAAMHFLSQNNNIHYLHILDVKHFTSFLSCATSVEFSCLCTYLCVYAYACVCVCVYYYRASLCTKTIRVTLIWLSRVLAWDYSSQQDLLDVCVCVCVCGRVRTYTNSN